MKRKKPRNPILSTKEWIQSSTAGQPNPIHRYREFHQDEIVNYFGAKGLDQPVHKSFRARTVTSAPAFVAIIKGGRVWGSNGIVFTPDNRLLADVSWEYTQRFIQSNRHSVFDKWKSIPIQDISGTVGHVSHVSSRNYFHWLFDVLPRVGLIRSSGEGADKYIFRGGGPPAYQDETLDMMGILPEQRIYTNHRLHLKAEKLIVPSLASRYEWSEYPQPVTYSRWACDFVRYELFLKQAAVNSTGGERLYVSRAKANHRRLLNEDEIMTKLAAIGFTAVDPGALSVKEQIGLFGSAKFIIAPHGAGLANLAFCSPGTKVVELFSPAYVPGYYWLLSNHFGLDYYYLIGNHAVMTRGKWEGGKDFYVNPEQLDRLLLRAGIE